MEFVRTPDDRFADLPGYSFEPHYVTLNDGFRMHFVDEGSRQARPVLLLHGQPSWSYLYRSTISTLVERGLRTVAPDLIGFGRSDKPVQRTAHTVAAHIDWLTEFIDALDLRRAIVVVQDWGGPLGLGALIRVPERFAGVVASNTALHTADSELAGRLMWAVHTNAEGLAVVEPTLLDYQRLTQELTPFCASLFLQGATLHNLPDDVCAAYDAPFPDETFCAGPRQLPLLMGLTARSACAASNRAVFDYLRTNPLPVVTAYSDGDPGTAGWAEVLQSGALGASDQPHHVIAKAGHFIQEDAGPQLAGVVADMAATLD